MTQSRKLIFYSLVLLIGLLMAIPAIVNGQSAAEWVVGPEPVTVGDPVNLTLTVNHPADTQVIFPDLAEAWPEATIAEQALPETVTNADGSLTTSQAVDARLFTPGDYATPAVAVTLSDAAGNLSEIGVLPTAVSVGSVLVEGDTALRDIKPQADMPLAEQWLLIIPVLMLGGFVIYAIIRRVRREKPFVDNRSPEQRALDDLAVVAEMGLPENGRFKEHYTLISDTLRLYVSNRYKVDVLERTTVELKRMIRQNDIPTDAAREFIKVLEESDMVKFADITPRIADAYLILDIATQFVEYTKPVDEDELPSKPTGGKSGKTRKAQFSVNGTHKKAEVTV